MLPNPAPAPGADSTPARSHCCPAVPSALPTLLQLGDMPWHPQTGSRHGHHVWGPTPAPGMWAARLCQGSEAAQQSLGRNHNVFDAQHAEPGWSRVLGHPGTAPSQGSWGRLLCPEGLHITQTGLQQDCWGKSRTLPLSGKFGYWVKASCCIPSGSRIQIPPQHPQPLLLWTVEVPAAEPHPQPSPLCTAEIPIEG